jgi:hypothetical protein
MLSHFARNMRENQCAVRQLHAEHRPRKNVFDDTFGFDRVFFGHMRENAKESGAAKVENDATE